MVAPAAAQGQSLQMPSWQGRCSWPQPYSIKTYFCRSRRYYLIITFFNISSGIVLSVGAVPGEGTETQCAPFSIVWATAFEFGDGAVASRVAVRN